MMVHYQSLKSWMLLFIIEYINEFENYLHKKENYDTQLLDDVLAHIVETLSKISPKEEVQIFPIKKDGLVS